ncbi:DUF2141 domain-containing protein [Shewanella mesophila]|uniref:DUF2141 domain-containing protein n=1 Tax=Shewanella mesophila TaxID=2864208 RepID=UPI001C65BF8D|nr:DUF2141 domain-containing protein [Shewanella mesophila]QYJ85133.1 DUF2141 domain-containing protein [Shewanella mesophila]
MKNIIQCSTVSALMLAMSLSPAAYADDLTLTIDNIALEQGKLLVALFSGEASYNSGQHAIASMMKPVTAHQHALVFTDLKPGEYAIKVIHDENDNNKLDSNFLGVPSEGYGFSNNAGEFGPASYQQAKFSLNGDTTITIHVR